MSDRDKDRHTTEAQTKTKTQAQIHTQRHTGTRTNTHTYTLDSFMKGDRKGGEGTFGDEMSVRVCTFGGTQQPMAPAHTHAHTLTPVAAAAGSVCRPFQREGVIILWGKCCAS